MADEIDFFDAYLQQSAPQRTILRFLRTLSATYQEFTPNTHEEEQALGVLVLAKGVQILDAEAPAIATFSPDTPRSCYVRLTSSGVNWHAILANNESKDAVKAQGAVLRFVFDAYCQNRDVQNQEATAPSTPPGTNHEAKVPAALIEAPESESEAPEDTEYTSQTSRSKSEPDAAPAAEPRRFIHKPWPGSDSWHNWGVGVDDEGIWHLFHFWRSGDAQAVYQWKHHRHARVEIAAGQMDAIARRFIERQSLPVSGDDEIKRIKAIISRLRKVISDAVEAEGHTPKGSPIHSPTTDRSAYLAAIKFGKVVTQSRHIRLDCNY